MLRILIIHSHILYVFTFALVSLAVTGCNWAALENPTSKNEPQSGKTGNSKKDNVAKSSSHKTHIPQDSVDQEKLEVAHKVICRIPTHNSAGAFIESIIPNGSLVQKGDFLIGFDLFDFESERTEILLRLSQAQADLARAKSEVEIAKLALETQTNEMVTQKQKFDKEIYKLKLDIRNQEAEVSKAKTMLESFERHQEPWDKAYKSLYEFTKESNEKLATLKSKVRQAEDKLTAAKSLNEQEKVANIELSKARRELEDFESEANSETSDLKRIVEFEHDELTQRKRKEYPTNQFHENLRMAVLIAEEDLQGAEWILKMAEKNLSVYERFHHPNKRTELEENIRIANIRLNSCNKTKQILSERLKQLQFIVDQHTVQAQNSGRVRYIEDMELSAGVECRNGQVLMLIMGSPQSETAGGPTRGGEKAGSGKGGRGQGQAGRAPGRGGAGGFSASAVIDGMMGRYDTNGDGVIDQDEMGKLSVRAREMIEAADGNRDGSVSKSELTSAMEERMRESGFGGRGGGQRGGGGRRDGGR